MSFVVNWRTWIASLWFRSSHVLAFWERSISSLASRHYDLHRSTFKRFGERSISSRALRQKDIMEQSEYYASWYPRALFLCQRVGHAWEFRSFVMVCGLLRYTHPRYGSLWSPVLRGNPNMYARNRLDHFSDTYLSRSFRLILHKGIIYRQQSDSEAALAKTVFVLLFEAYNTSLKIFWNIAKRPIHWSMLSGMWLRDSILGFWDLLQIQMFCY